MYISKSIHLYKFRKDNERVSSLAIKLIGKLQGTVGLSNVVMEHINGCILEAEENIVVNGVNCSSVYATRLNISLFRNSVRIYCVAPDSTGMWSSKENAWFLSRIDNETKNFVKNGYADIVVMPKKVSGVESYVERYIDQPECFYTDSDVFAKVEDIDSLVTSVEIISRKRGFFASLFRAARGKRRRK